MSDRGPAGTLAWSALVDNLTTLEAANDSLLADAGYLGLVSKASSWTSTPAEDFPLRMIHTSGGDYVRPAVGAYAEGTVAVPANGQLAQQAPGASTSLTSTRSSPLVGAVLHVGVRRVRRAAMAGPVRLRSHSRLRGRDDRQGLGLRSEARRRGRPVRGRTRLTHLGPPDRLRSPRPAPPLYGGAGQAS